MRMENKTAIVTGAGTGLGQAIAESFAREGAAMVLVGRRSEPLSKVVKKIRQEGGRALAVPADAANAGQVESVMNAALAAYGRIDVLVNNAGAVLSRTPLHECAESEWLATIEANLHTAYLCSRAAVPHLKRTRGNIVQIASVFALLGAADSGAYTAAKGALVSLTRAMAVDLGPDGVRVNAVCPAYIETDMNRQMLREARASGRFDYILSQLPLGVLGDPADVAHAVLYLASAEARWVTGVALPVDGGMAAGRPPAYRLSLDPDETS